MNAWKILLLLFSFQSLQAQYLNPGIAVTAENIPLEKEQFYFPLEVFPETVWPQDTNPVNDIEVYIMEYDTFVVSWYSKQLYALQEPLLFNKPLEKEVYRFTWLRTWHSPIAVRIEKGEDNKVKLYWKVCNGAGGYEPGKLIKNKSKIVSKKNWEQFLILLNQADYWNLALGRNSAGLDGSEWILEGNNGQNYRAVSRWSPEDGAYHDACQYLIKLTDLNIKNKAKY